MYLESKESYMINPTQLETAFQHFAENLHQWIPDGITVVNLDLLQDLGLLKTEELEDSETDDLMHCFHVVEMPDKVTLFNDLFAVWIVPKTANDIASTLTFIALLQKNTPHLEIVFSTEGVYNSPKYILKVLQHFLTEVIDTESTILSMEKPKEKPQDIL